MTAPVTCAVCEVHAEAVFRVEGLGRPLTLTYPYAFLFEKKCDWTKA